MSSGHRFRHKHVAIPNIKIKWHHYHWHNSLMVVKPELKKCLIYLCYKRTIPILIPVLWFTLLPITTDTVHFQVLVNVVENNHLYSYSSNLATNMSASNPEALAAGLSHPRNIIQCLLPQYPLLGPRTSTLLHKWCLISCSKAIQ